MTNYLKEISRVSPYLTVRTGVPGRPGTREEIEPDEAYRECLRIARSHYENFTVGSWLLPRRLRRHVAAIYAFARIADDFADEGDASCAQRLALLAAWELELRECFEGRATTPVFVALRDTVSEFELPIEPFLALLAAFRYDVDFRPFESFEALRGYCRGSADPVGHLILGLFGYRDAERRALSDRVCTGLQLANLWQDVAVDAARGRIYLPRDEMDAFGCRAADVHAGRVTPAFRELLRFEVDRARRWLTEGLALADRVDGRLAREVRLFAWGGVAILNEIAGRDYDVLAARPTVSAGRKALLVGRALLGIARPPAPNGPRPACPGATAPGGKRDFTGGAP